VDGVGCLAQILANVDDSSEMVRSEAAGVVAQISSPGLEHYEPVTGFIENMEDLVQSLTGRYRRRRQPPTGDILAKLLLLSVLCYPPHRIRISFFIVVPPFLFALSQPPAVVVASTGPHRSHRPRDCPCCLVTKSRRRLATSAMSRTLDKPMLP